VAAKLRIPDAAYCIGATPLSIRKWLEKNQIKWLAQARPQKGMAAEFGTLDLLRMRLVVVLLEYGATVDEASKLVYHAWQTFFPPDPPHPDDEDLTIAAILDIFSDVFDRLIFARVKGQEWSITVTDKPKDKIPSAALVITPHNLFSEVIDRARALQERRSWVA
jgi:hypothetical protein